MILVILIFVITFILLLRILLLMLIKFDLFIRMLLSWLLIFNLLWLLLCSHREIFPYLFVRLRQVDLDYLWFIWFNSLPKLLLLVHEVNLTVPNFVILICCHLELLYWSKYLKAMTVNFVTEFHRVLASFMRFRFLDSKEVPSTSFLSLLFLLHFLF